MKKITSYEQYKQVKYEFGVIATAKKLQAKMKTQDGIDNTNRLIEKHIHALAKLGYTPDEAQEALDHDKEQYECINKAVSTSTVSNFKSAIDSMWEEGVPALTALDKANKASLSPENIEWV